MAELARARWPEDGDGEVPGVPGFVFSGFAPVVVAVAERCLRRRHGTAPVPAGTRTAIVLVTASEDRASAEHVRATVEAGGRVGPLFFYQSVPNSVAGHLAARWGCAARWSASARPATRTPTAQPRRPCCATTATPTRCCWS